VFGRREEKTEIARLKKEMCMQRNIKEELWRI
jgi:hypothetical protein